MHVSQRRPEFRDRQRRGDVTLDDHVARVIQRAGIGRAAATEQRACLSGGRHERLGAGLHQHRDTVPAGQLGGRPRRPAPARTRRPARRPRIGGEHADIGRAQPGRQRHERLQALRGQQRPKRVLNRHARNGQAVFATEREQLAGLVGRRDRLPGADRPLDRLEARRERGARPRSRGSAPGSAALNRQIRRPTTRPASAWRASRSSRSRPRRTSTPAGASASGAPDRMRSHQIGIGDVGARERDQVSLAVGEDLLGLLDGELVVADVSARAAAAQLARNRSHPACPGSCR